MRTSLVRRGDGGASTGRRRGPGVTAPAVVAVLLAGGLLLGSVGTARAQGCVTYAGLDPLTMVPKPAGTANGKVTGNTSADPRRKGTFQCDADQVVATPTVQLYNFSTANGNEFQTEMNGHAGHSFNDLVMVLTRAQCGTTTQNRVIAYYS